MPVAVVVPLEVVVPLGVGVVEPGVVGSLVPGGMPVSTPVGVVVPVPVPLVVPVVVVFPVTGAPVPVPLAEGAPGVTLAVPAPSEFDEPLPQAASERPDRKGSRDATRRPGLLVIGSTVCVRGMLGTRPWGGSHGCVQAGAATCCYAR